MPKTLAESKAGAYSFRRTSASCWVCKSRWKWDVETLWHQERQTWEVWIPGDDFSLVQFLHCSVFKAVFVAGFSKVFQWFYTLSSLIRFNMFGFEKALFSNKPCEMQWCGQCSPLKYDLKSNCFLLVLSEKCPANFCRRFGNSFVFPCVCKLKGHWMFLTEACLFLLTKFNNYGCMGFFFPDCLGFFLGILIRLFEINNDSCFGQWVWPSGLCENGKGRECTCSSDVINVLVLLTVHWFLLKLWTCEMLLSKINFLLQAVLLKFAF